MGVIAKESTGTSRPRRRTASSRPSASRQLRVALYDDLGGSSTKRAVTNCRGAADLEACLRGAAGRVGEFKTHRLTGRDIAEGALKEGRYDILVQPGGEGVAQGKQLGESGMQAIRDFVSDGHGYIGICAGANLASSDPNYMPHALGLLASRSIDTQPSYPQVKNLRGVGTADIVFTPLGKQVFDTEVHGVANVVYANGPILARDDSNTTDPLRSSFEVLATYETEVRTTAYARQLAHLGEDHDMIGKPAVIAAPYGSGRVLCMSPHPEKPQGANWMIRSAVRWTAGAGTRRPEIPFRRTLKAVPSPLKAYRGPAVAIAAADGYEQNLDSELGDEVVSCDESEQSFCNDSFETTAGSGHCGSVRRLRDMLRLAGETTGPLHDFAAIGRCVDELLEEQCHDAEEAERQAEKEKRKKKRAPSVGALHRAASAVQQQHRHSTTPKRRTSLRREVAAASSPHALPAALPTRNSSFAYSSAANIVSSPKAVPRKPVRRVPSFGEGGSGSGSAEKGAMGGSAVMRLPRRDSVAAAMMRRRRD